MAALNFLFKEREAELRRKEEEAAREEDRRARWVQKVEEAAREEEKKSGGTGGAQGCQGGEDRIVMWLQNE